MRPEHHRTLITSQSIGARVIARMTISHSSRSQFTVTWELALKQYASAVGKQLEYSSLPHPSSVEELLQRLDDQNSRFSQFLETKRPLFHILTCMCNLIERFGSIAASIASNVFAPSSVCFSAIVYLIDAAKDVSASYNAIIGLFVTLKAGSPGPLRLSFVG